MGRKDLSGVKSLYYTNMDKQGGNGDLACLILSTIQKVCQGLCLWYVDVEQVVQLSGFI